MAANAAIHLYEWRATMMQNVTAPTHVPKNCTAAMTRLKGSCNLHNCFNRTKNMSLLMVFIAHLDRMAGCCRAISCKTLCSLTLSWHAQR